MCTSGKTSIKNRTAHPESHDHAQRQPPLQPRNEELRDSESCCRPDRLRLNPLESVFWSQIDLARVRSETRKQSKTTKNASPFSRARWQNRSPRKRANQKQMHVTSLKDRDNTCTSERYDLPIESDVIIVDVEHHKDKSKCTSQKRRMHASHRRRIETAHAQANAGALLGLMSL